MDAAARRALDIMSLMRLEDGQRWADTAAQFQRDNAAAILSTDGPLQSWYEGPRGARKTTDIAALSLAVLTAQAPPMSRSYIGASDEDQAAELIDAARGLAERTEELHGEFVINELVITSARTGASVTALAADTSAFGKRAYLIILDEIANWPETKKARRFWSTLMSGNRKLPECRTIVITNSGDPSHWAWKRRETARLSKHWRFVSVPGPLPWLTETDLAILRENSETPSEYERLVLNKWTAAEDRLADRAEVDACTVLPGPQPPRGGVRYVIAADLGSVNDRAVVAVLHADDGATGRGASLDRLERWQGTRAAPVDLGAVRDTIASLSGEYNRAEVVIDPWQAKLLAAELREAGVVVREFNFTSTSVGRLALSLHSAIRQRRISLYPDTDLADELCSVRLIKNSGGTFRIDHDSGQHDDQAVTLALGVHHLLDAAPDPVWVWPGDGQADGAGRAGETNIFDQEIMQAAGPFGFRIDPHDADAQTADMQRRLVRTLN